MTRMVSHPGFCLSNKLLCMVILSGALRKD